MANKYLEYAIDEVYNILLYNPPDVDDTVKIETLEWLLKYYEDSEEYDKCKNITELIRIIEEPYGNSSKET